MRDRIGCSCGANYQADTLKLEILQEFQTYFLNIILILKIYFKVLVKHNIKFQKLPFSLSELNDTFIGAPEPWGFP